MTDGIADSIFLLEFIPLSLNVYISRLNKLIVQLKIKVLRIMDYTNWPRTLHLNVLKFSGLSQVSICCV
jgi:hypothetical protein